MRNYSSNQKKGNTSYLSLKKTRKSFDLEKTEKRKFKSPSSPHLDEFEMRSIPGEISDLEHDDYGIASEISVEKVKGVEIATNSSEKSREEIPVYVKQLLETQSNMISSLQSQINDL